MPDQPSVIKVAKGLIDTQRFLKDAFCIDGECKFIDFVSFSSMSLPGEISSAVFELNDSKRGKFYVTLSR